MAKISKKSSTNRPVESALANPYSSQAAGWVPTAVMHQAALIQDQLKTIGAPAGAFALLDRLVTDSRMEMVWDQLQKRKVANPLKRKITNPLKFVHEAKVTFFEKATQKKVRAIALRRKGGLTNLLKADELDIEAELLENLPDIPTSTQFAHQDQGMAFLFHHAFWYAARPIPLVSLREVDAAKTRLLTIAEDLRERASSLRSLGLEEQALTLEDVTRDCEEQAFWSQPDDSDVGVVHRHRGDQLLNAYLVWVANCTSETFGSPLYGTLATIANVALQRSDLDDRKVRDILRKKPDPGL